MIFYDILNVILLGKQLLTPPDTSFSNPLANINISWHFCVVEHPLPPCPNHTGHRKGRAPTWESSEGEELCGWSMFGQYMLIIPTKKWFVTEFLSTF